MSLWLTSSPPSKLRRLWGSEGTWSSCNTLLSPDTSTATCGSDGKATKLAIVATATAAFLHLGLLTRMTYLFVTFSVDHEFQDCCCSYGSQAPTMLSQLYQGSPSNYPAPTGTFLPSAALAVGLPSLAFEKQSLHVLHANSMPAMSHVALLACGSQKQRARASETNLSLWNQACDLLSSFVARRPSSTWV